MGSRLLDNARQIKWLLLLGLALIVVALGIKLWRISIPARSLYASYDQLQALAAAPSRADIVTLPPLVSGAHQDLVTLQRELRPFDGVLRRLGWLPRIGPEVAAAPDLLALGVSLSAAGDTMITAISPLVEALAAETQPSAELLPLAVQTLAEAQPAFAEARLHVEQAKVAYQRLDPESLSPRLAEPLARLEAVWPYTDLAFDAARLAPAILGAESERTYLILSQNNDELRPTGGFISALGRLTVSQGEIIAFSFEDSYAVDDFDQTYPDAPEQLLRYMFAWMWLVRDANWSPDFPTSVADLLSLYAVTRDAAVDGVIAVDQVALQEIVTALQPVPVPGWETPATGENVITLIRDSWSPDDEDFSGWDREWWENRKSFVSDLSAALRQRVEQSPGEVDWLRLGQAVLKILDERHLQVWLADEAEQTLITAQNWGGTIRPAEGDYLLVVDSNLGFNKVNAVAETALHYEVDLSTTDPLEGRLRLTHRNDSQGKQPCLHKPRYGKDYWEIINRCYWSYVRVYAPAGAELLAATPHEISGQFLLNETDEPARIEHLPPEGGKTVWGTLILTPHASQVETTFRYRLPDDLLAETEAGWRYRLLLQKQAGTLANPAQVVVHLPSGSKLKAANPAPAQAADGRLVFDLDLRTDREVDIIFE